MEGWEAWDIILKCAGQLRVSQHGVIGIDMNAALKVAAAAGYDIVAISEFMPGCEKGTVIALNEKFAKG